MSVCRRQSRPRRPLPSPATAHLPLPVPTARCPSPVSHYPLPVACHSPTPTRTTTPMAARWLRHNTTHHADHISPMARGPSPLTATEATNNNNDGLGGAMPPCP